MRSARSTTYRASILAACVLLLAVVATGCQTTQDIAAERQAESKRILEQREQKQKQRKADRKKDQER